QPRSKPAGRPQTWRALGRGGAGFGLNVGAERVAGTTLGLRGVAAAGLGRGAPTPAATGLGQLVRLGLLGLELLLELGLLGVVLGAGELGEQGVDLGG